MIKQLCFWSLIFILLSFDSLASPSDLVRVRMRKNLKSIVISGFQIQSSHFNVPMGFHKLSFSLNTLGEWVIQSETGFNQKITQNELILQGEWMRAGPRALPSKIVLVKNKTLFDLIGHVDLTLYLSGVLVGELPIQWPLEALKAQAVAARSYTLSVMNQRKNSSYDLESCILDQVFEYIEPHNLKHSHYQKVSQAVKETENMVLLTPHKTPFKAHYHADSGGFTLSADHVWGLARDRTGIIKDVIYPQSPYREWKYFLSTQGLHQKLSKLKNHPSSFIEKIIPYYDPQTSRVIQLEFVYPEGSHILSGNNFRKIFGYHNIKSTRFQISRQENGLLLTGSGYGHGVGLSQWGARQLALEGKTFKEILAHYYPSAQLSK